MLTCSFSLLSYLADTLTCCSLSLQSYPADTLTCSFSVLSYLVDTLTCYSLSLLSYLADMLTCSFSLLSYPADTLTCSTTSTPIIPTTHWLLCTDMKENNKIKQTKLYIIWHNKLLTAFLFPYNFSYVYVHLILLQNKWTKQFSFCQPHLHFQKKKDKHKKILLDISYSRASSKLKIFMKMN